MLKACVACCYKASQRAAQALSHVPGGRAGSPSFRDLLARAKAVMRGALDNADLPFTRVVEAVGVARSAAHSPLFQVMCALQDASLDEEVVMDGLTQDAVEVPARARQIAALGCTCDLQGCLQGLHVP